MVEVEEGEGAIEVEVEEVIIKVGVVDKDKEVVEEEVDKETLTGHVNLEHNVKKLQVDNVHLVMIKVNNNKIKFKLSIHKINNLHNHREVKANIQNNLLKVLV